VLRLPRALDDIEYIQNLFGDSATSGTATTASIRNAFEQASFVIIAARGSSARRPRTAREHARDPISDDVLIGYCHASVTM